MFCEDFLPFCRFSFCRLFIVQMPFSLMSSHLFIFAFITQAFGVISKKSLPRSMSRSSSPIFSFRNFMASGLLFNFLIYGVDPVSFFVCGYPVFPTPFIKETILPPLCILPTFVKNQVNIYVCAYFWSL